MQRNYERVRVGHGTVRKQQQWRGFEKSLKNVKMELNGEWDKKLNLVESIFIGKKQSKQRKSIFWDIKIFVRLV